MTRPYRLGRRQPGVDQTARSIVAAAREVVAARPGAVLSVAEVARRAAVSRITVYNRFGSRQGLLDAVAPPPPGPPPPLAGEPRTALHSYLAARCTAWATHPALYRHLPTAGESPPEDVRQLAARLAAADALRPGCSVREAEDVLGALACFAVFDRLHKDGRRSPAAVAEVLMRMASGILA